MRTPQELLDLVQAAAAYDIVMQSADGDGGQIPPPLAEILRAMLNDLNYREAAKQAWHELFKGCGKPTAARVSELYREIEEWVTSRKPPEWQYASDTEDTPPTSRIS